MYRVGFGQQSARDGVAGLVVGGDLLLLARDDARLALGTGDDPITANTIRMTRYHDALLFENAKPHHLLCSLIASTLLPRKCTQPLAESAGLDVIVDGPSARVVADPALLEQSLLIPITNSIQHSDPGQTVRLHISRASVTVEDDGGGIDEEDLPHLFERFYTGKGFSGGPGLGLPICKDLLEKMGGEISIRSEKCVGTSVRIDLPEAEPDA